MAGHGQADEALEVIAGVPYADAFALELFRLRIEILKLSGRREQAIAELQAHPDVGNWRAAWPLAELLEDAGRRGSRGPGAGRPHRRLRHKPSSPG
jgi:hypothetical protein